MSDFTGLLKIIEDVLDKIIPEPEAKAKAQSELAKLAQDGALTKMANDASLFTIEQYNQALIMQPDMPGDTWLSRNIRPLTLIAIFSGYFIFAMMSAFGYQANESYVQLLGQWGMLVMSFYFGGKTVEKIMEFKSKK